MDWPTVLVSLGAIIAMVLVLYWGLKQAKKADASPMPRSRHRDWYCTYARPGCWCKTQITGTPEQVKDFVKEFGLQNMLLDERVPRKKDGADASDA